MGEEQQSGCFTYAAGVGAGVEISATGGARGEDITRPLEQGV